MRACHSALAPFIIRTPTLRLTSARISDALGGAEVWLKCELFQHTGSFKARGALTVARGLDAQTRARGITAASAGNHAIAAAWAARQCGLDAKVVMQNTASPYRIARAEAEGATIILKEPGAPTMDEADRLVAEEGRAYIHPFEGPGTTLGAAGVGIELIEDTPPLDAVVIAVGGGGLMSGVASAVRALSPGTRILGVEPDGAASMSASIAAGHPVTLDRTETIADSLAPPFALPYSFGICRALVDRIVTLGDTDMIAAMALMLEEAKLAVEPAGAAALAAALGPLRAELAGKRVGLVICGANIDTERFNALLSRARP